MTDYRQALVNRFNNYVNLDEFPDPLYELLESFCKVLDATGRPWRLLNIKTKFTFDDLRFYVEGDHIIQKFVRGFEAGWYTMFREDEHD